MAKTPGTPAQKDGNVDASSSIRGKGGAPEPRLARISRRAYELYERRGGEHGREMQDWLQAEREIDGADDDRP